MKRILIPLAAAAAIVPGAAALASNSHHASAARSKHRTIVKLHSTSAGTILVNRKGFTLYDFAKDSKGKDRCSAACKSIWPPLYTKGKPRAGKGVNASLLGTIKLRNGKLQVTYAGHPLYTYVVDSHPAETKNIGVPSFGAPWYALTATGKEIKKP